MQLRSIRAWMESKGREHFFLEWGQISRVGCWWEAPSERSFCHLDWKLEREGSWGVGERERKRERISSRRGNRFFPPMRIKIVFKNLLLNDFSLCVTVSLYSSRLCNWNFLATYPGCVWDYPHWTMQQWLEMCFCLLLLGQSLYCLPVVGDEEVAKSPSSLYHFLFLHMAWFY